MATKKRRNKMNRAGDNLKALGIAVKDTKDGAEWSFE